MIIAAMRSPAGASAALLAAARYSVFRMIGTVALALEYEATCLLPEHRAAAGLSPGDVDAFVNGVLAMIEPIEPYFLWRPQLRDPGDELVLEAAINGQAAAFVTFNRRDFGAAPARFGIEPLTPRQMLQRVRT